MNIHCEGCNTPATCPGVHDAEYEAMVDALLMLSKELTRLGCRDLDVSSCRAAIKKIESLSLQIGNLHKEIERWERSAVEWMRLSKELRAEVERMKKG